MARRLNKKTVAILTVLGMIALTVLAIVMLWKLPQRDPVWNRRLAEQAATQAANATDPEVRKEAWARAAKFYLRAAQAAGKTTPEALRYMVLAGQMHYRRGDAGKAIGTWSKVIEIDPTFVDAHVKLVEFSLELFRLSPDPGWLTQMLKYAQGLEDALAKQGRTDPHLVGLAHYAKGMALLARPEREENDIRQGVADLKAAIEAEPANPDYASRLAFHYEQLAQAAATEGEQGRRQAATYRAEAENLYRKLLETCEQRLRRLEEQAATASAPAASAPAGGDELAEARADCAKAHRYYAEYLLRQNRPQEALPHLQEASRLVPDDVDTTIALARYWQARGDLDKARKAYERAIRLDPDGHTAYVSLAELFLRTNQPDRALEICKARLARPVDRSSYKALRQRFGHFRLLLEAVRATLAMANAPDANKDKLFEQAEQFVQEAEHEINENALTHMWRGRILAQKGKPHEAVRELTQAAKLMEGRTGAGIERAQLETYLGLADLQFRLGEIGSAREYLQKALQIAPGYVPGILLLARVENASDNPNEALRYAQQASQLIERLTDANLAARLRAESLQIQMEAYGKLGQHSRVLVLAEQLNKLQTTTQPDTVEARLERARILLLAEDLKAAEAELRKVLEREPANIPAIRQLVWILNQENRADEIQPIIERARQADPENRVLKVFEIVAKLADKPEQRDREIKKLIEADKDPLSRAIQLYLYYARRQQWDSARQHLDEAEKLKPDDPAILRRQFDLALLLKDYKRAARYVTKATEQNLDNAGGALFRARLLMAQNKPAEAARIIREAMGKYGGDSTMYATLGNALLMARDLDAAQTAFEEALQRNPRSGAAHAGLARLAYLRGDEDAKRRHLLECQRLGFLDTWVSRQLEFEQERQNPQAGIERREKIRKERPDDTENLLRLASLYQRVRKPAEAARCLEQAAKAAPDTLEIVRRAARMYADLGEPQYVQAGRKLLEDFIARCKDAPTKARAWAALAQYYRVLNQQDQADAAYKQAANTSPQPGIYAEIAGWYQRTNRPEQAASWYDKAVQAAKDPDMKRRIRRMQVEFLLEQGDPEAARPVVEAFAADYPDEPRRLLYQGELELQLGREDKALENLNRFIEQNRDQAVGYYRRGYLYFLQSLWQPAIDDLQRAKTLAPNGFNYQHRLLLARAFELSGRGDEAVSELEELLEAAPDSSQIIQELLRTLRRLKRFRDAEDLARRMVMRHPNDPFWHMQLGAIALEAGKREKAIGPFRKAVELSNFAPTAVAALLDAYLRLGMPERVVQFVEKELPPDHRDATVYARLARAYKQAGNLDQAFASYEQAVAKAQVSPEACYRLISNMIRVMGKSLGKYVEQRLAQDPEHRVWRLCKAKLLQELRKYDEAQTILNALLESAKTDEDRFVALLTLAQNEHLAGKYEAARRHYEQYIKLRPDDPVAMNNLAYMLADTLKKPELAVVYAEKAARQAPGASAVLDTLGWIYTLLGQYHKAVAALRRAVNLEPESALLHYHLAEAYIGKQDKPSALRELQRARELLAKAEQSADEKAELTRKINQAFGKIGVSP